MNIQTLKFVDYILNVVPFIGIVIATGVASYGGAQDDASKAFKAFGVAILIFGASIWGCNSLYSWLHKQGVHPLVGWGNLVPYEKYLEHTATVEAADKKLNESIIK